MKFSDFKQRIRGIPVFSTSMLGTLSPHPDTLKVQISLWKKKGLVQPLRKGLYLLCPQERVIEPPLFYLANQILIPSYVSMESALSFYGLIPEFVAAATSVTVRKTCRFENAFGLFTYQHLRPECFFGFEPAELPGKWRALMASPEKAVVDFLYLNLSRWDPRDKAAFIGSYRFQNGKRLKPARLRAQAKRFGTKKLLLAIESFIQEAVL